MARILKRPMLVALGLVTALSGCASGPMIDALPSGVAPPSGAPVRPATAFEFPAVHDMPPARTAAPMTEEQQLKLENELTAVRERQEAQDAPAKKTAKPAKRKPATGDNAQAAGAKTNP